MSREVLALLALPLIAISIALAANLAIASFRSPVGVMLPVFAAIVPIGSIVVVPVPLPPPFNTPSSLVGAMALGALIVHLLGERIAGGSSGARWVPLAVAWWVLFAVVASVSVLWSVNPSESVDELAVLVTLVAMYALAAFAHATPTDLRRTEDAITLGGVIAAVYAVVLLASSGLSVFGGDTPRFAASGGVGDEAGPNETAAALLVPLAIAIGRAVDPSVHRRGRWIAASALIATAIALTASRGGLLSVVVVVTVVAWNARRVWIVGLVGASAITALVIVPAFISGGLHDRLFKETSSGRTLIWRTALDACEQHCLFGSGYGTFPDVYNEARGVSPELSGQRLRQRAHNIWIRAGIETGLFGLVLMTGALYLHARDLGRLPRRFRGPPLAGFLGVLTANMFLSNIGFKYFWLAMIHALLTTVVWTRSPVRTTVDPSPLRPLPARIGRRVLA